MYDRMIDLYHGLAPDRCGMGDAGVTADDILEQIVRSVRFDPDLEGRVERAAKKRGVTVSDFIRAAVRRECDDALGGEPKEDWKAMLLDSPYGADWIKALDGIVGAVDGGE